jgi:hypothetical protein
VRSIFTHSKSLLLIWGLVPWLPQAAGYGPKNPDTT